MHHSETRKILANQTYRLFEKAAIYMIAGPVEDYIQSAQKGDVCLINLQWTLTPSNILLHLKLLRRLKTKGVRPIILCNEPREMRICKLMNFPSVLMPQNQFTVEAFIPCRTAQTTYRYDAFYAAQGHKFKRMHLASDIEKLYILTYRCPRDQNGEHCPALVAPEIAHADFNRGWVSSFNEILAKMNDSACTLALSKKEGMMWAVVESWLAGIPVVSTKSTGGRDRYFHPETTVIVDDNAKSVAEGVARARDLATNPERIREVALELMEKDRRDTVTFFQKQLLPKNAYTDEEVYERLYTPSEQRIPI